MSRALFIGDMPWACHWISVRAGTESWETHGASLRSRDARAPGARALDAFNSGFLYTMAQGGRGTTVERERRRGAETSPARRRSRRDILLPGEQGCLVRWKPEEEWGDEVDGVN